MSWQDILKGPKYDAAKAKYDQAKQEMDEAAVEEGVSMRDRLGSQTQQTSTRTQQTEETEQTPDDFYDRMVAPTPQKKRGKIDSDDLYDRMVEPTPKRGEEAEEPPKKTGVSRLRELREATGKRIKDRQEQPKEKKVPKGMRTGDEGPKSTQPYRLPKLDRDAGEGKTWLQRQQEQAKLRREKIYSKGKDWKDALQRRRQEISERGPSPGDRREEARHARQAKERKELREKEEKEKQRMQQARAARKQARKDKREAKSKARWERNMAAREKMFADMERRDAAAAERRRKAEEKYAKDKKARQEIKERKRAGIKRGKLGPGGSAGSYEMRPIKQKTPTGQPSSTTQTGGEQGQEAQRRLNEQTEQATQALKDVANKLNKSVIKMNNDKYNAEQKSEPNRNFTPFVPLEKKRVMPEKQNKIPGVIQHSRPKRKKTENKW